MTIKTLTYIHNLLIENEKKTMGARKTVSQALKKAEEENADNIETLKRVNEETFRAWSKAFDSLKDFEAQEW